MKSIGDSTNTVQKGIQKKYALSPKEYQDVYQKDPARIVPEKEQ